jgi:magnesium transporter
MNDWVRDELLDALEPGEVAELAGQLDTDDAVAIIEDMEADEQQAVSRARPRRPRRDRGSALLSRRIRRPHHAPRLRGGAEHWNVGQLIDFLRGTDELTTDFWEIYVVDPLGKPVGTILLSWVLRAPRSICIVDLMQREQTLIPVDMDQEEVALRFQKLRADHGRRGGRVGAAGRDDHRRRHRPHHPGGSQRGRAVAVGRR